MSLTPHNGVQEVSYKSRRAGAFTTLSERVLTSLASVVVLFASLIADPFSVN